MTYDIQFVDTPVNAYLEKLASEKLYSLGRKFDWIINADIILKEIKDPKGKGHICEIKLSLPGPMIFASSNEEGLEAAIAETVRDLERQCKKRKGEFRPHAF